MPAVLSRRRARCGQRVSRRAAGPEQQNLKEKIQAIPRRTNQALLWLGHRSVADRRTGFRPLHAVRRAFPIRKPPPRARCATPCCRRSRPGSRWTTAKAAAPRRRSLRCIFTTRARDRWTWDPTRGSASRSPTGGILASPPNCANPAATPFPAEKPFLFQQWTVDGGLRDINPVHMLGSAVGIGFEVPAGKSYELVIAIGSYLDHIVTTGLEGKYLYAHHFGSLGEVLSEALDRADELRAAAEARDAELLASGLSADQQFLIAHSTRSYYGSTQLLEVGGEPFFIVNEGEYCMMNTLDLSIDHVFWELKQNPWVVKNLLDNFVRHYSYIDEVKRDRGDDSRRSPGGISFTHDMGVHNNFSPPGTSSYELKNLTGCFSYMTAEQLCNWSLLAATYVLKTGDLSLGAAEPARAVGLRDQPGQPRRRNRIRPLRLFPLRKRRGNHHLRFAGQFPGPDPKQRLYGGQMLGQLSRPGDGAGETSGSRRENSPG